MEVTRRNILSAFWSQARRYRWRYAAAVLAAVLGAVAQMLEPVAGKWILDALATPPFDAPLIGRLFAFLAALLVGSWLFGRVMWLLLSAFEARLQARAKERVFARLVRRSAGFFSDAHVGQIVHDIRRFGDSFTDLDMAVLTNFLPAGITVVSFTVILFWRSTLMAAVFAVWVVLLTWLQWWFAKIRQHAREVARAAATAASAYMADAVNNAAAIKTFAREAFEDARVSAHYDRAATIERREWFTDEWLWSGQSVLFLALNVFLLWEVLSGIGRGRFTLGDFVLMQGYMGLLWSFFGNLTNFFRQVPRLMADAVPATQWLREDPEILDAPDARPLRVRGGEIAFDRVSFAYANGKPVLRDFSLRVAPGEKIALVGPSGAGKSTVTKLLYRFYDTTKGRVMIDGQDVARVTQESLRRQLSLVPQDPALFHRSVADNIRYARPGAPARDVERAAHRAHCHEFVRMLPRGYQTLVGERGVKLSGGERQRVAIARAILADAPILVLDEATSSLDSASEALIQDALRRLMRDKTVIVIAHRLSTIMEMDRIVVMERGRVADIGTHEQLLRRDGTYRHLWELQSGGYITEEEQE